MASVQFAGLASGIDSKALIDSIIQARDIRNEIRRQEIDHLTSETDSLETLNEKILALKDLVEAFRTVNGGGVKKKATSSNSDSVTAIAGASAANSSFSVTVGSLANSATASFNQTYSSASSFISTAGSGNVTLTVGDSGDPEATITVAVTQNSTTVQQFVDSINNHADADGNIVASIVNVGTEASPSYKVMLNTLQQGLDDGSLAISANPAITELTAQTLSQATNASFSVTGITGNITRATNNISDVINGLTLNLAATGTATIAVGNDATSTSEAVEEIVTAYNDIVDFINENDLVERVEKGEDAKNVFGSLAKTNVDNDFLAGWRLRLAEANSSNGTTVTSIAEMGISTNRDGTLEFDADALKEAIGQDATGVSEVLTSFADSVGGSSGLLNQYTRFDGFIDVAQETNQNEIDNINEAIDRLDRTNESLRERLNLQFSRLEALTGKLQSQSSSLTGILASLG